MNNRVLLGMSGGVDSSVAALLLKEAGYQVEGVTMLLHTNSACGGADRAEEAAALCRQIGIPHHTQDYTREFRRRVIDDFIRCYSVCRTPNPCVECNKYLKFGLMYQKARRLGCDYISTGHYAKVEYSEKYGGKVLKKRASVQKDQSYFLYNITPEILERLILPLSDFEDKARTRAVAARQGLSAASKPDSEDVCFIPGGDYKSFLEQNSDIRPLPGDICLADGTVLGRHQGLYRYTVGQRKGLGIAYSAPLYVTGFDRQNNRLMVGQESRLYTGDFEVFDVNWAVKNPPESPFEASVKIRFSQKEYPAVVIPGKRGTAKVVFRTPQKSVTPGQSRVFYDGDILLGGGKIL